LRERRSGWIGSAASKQHVRGTKRRGELALKCIIFTIRFAASI